MFAEINDRREQVRKPHQETFRWIFEDGNETGFADWLSSGEGIFWIHGKPASGKSTLMKFITHEGRLNELLETWSGGTPLVVASFYFWATGHHLQRSILGLYRTLVHQILRADECLCRVAFPEWQDKFATAEPTIETLTAAMNNILTSRSLSKNFFFIIDGLDEYDRDSIGKTLIAEMMLSLTQSPRVKLLISSRPENPFKTVFWQCPTLRLEQLTAVDIETYVKKMLWSNPSARSISDAEKSSVNDIASFILEHAQGVFLWVVLVVRITLDGINNFEDLSKIRDRVMNLPPELDQIFTHILMQRIPHNHRQEAFRCLYIAFTWQSEHVAQFSPSDLPYEIISIARRASTYEEACDLAQSTCSESPQYFLDRLANRCQGLLEAGGVVVKSEVEHSVVNDSPEHNSSNEECCSKRSDRVRVTFLHRTLFDYLNEEKRAQLLLEPELDDTFDVYTAIMAGVICAPRERSNFHYDRQNNPAWKFFYLNLQAERSTAQPRSELITLYDLLESSARAAPVEDFRQSKRHWSAAIFEHGPRTESSILVCAAYCGAARYIQRAIDNGEVSDNRDRTLLLYYALTSFLFMTEKRGKWPVQPSIAICALLLDHGADPACEIKGLCPWAMLLDWIIEHASKEPTLTEDGFDEMSVALQLLLRFARGAPDLQKCSAIELTYQANRYNASKALRSLVLERSCCHDRFVQACSCPKAQVWAPIALEVLQLFENLETARTVGTLEDSRITTPGDASQVITIAGRSSSKTRHMLGLKRFLPSRRRGHN